MPGLGCSARSKSNFAVRQSRLGDAGCSDVPAKSLAPLGAADED